MSIKIIGESDRRPAVICAACEHRNVVDIRGFNQDMTRIAKIKCKGCNRWIYMGLLLAANLDQQALFGHIQLMCDAVATKATLRVGEQGTVEASGKILNQEVIMQIGLDPQQPG